VPVTKLLRNGFHSCKTFTTKMETQYKRTKAMPPQVVEDFAIIREDDIGPSFRQITETLQLIQSSQSEQLSDFVQANQTSMTVQAVLFAQSIKAMQTAQSAQSILIEFSIQQLEQRMLAEIDALHRRVAELEEIIVTQGGSVACAKRRFKRSRSVSL
jgi:translation initiation factor 6 (eIF-6)